MLKTGFKFYVAIAILLLTTSIIHAKNISAYYTASYATNTTVKANLQKAGFEILTTYSPAEKSY